MEIGETIQLGYFAQEVPDMNTEQRVIDYIKDVAEYLPTKDRKILGISDAGAISVYTGNAVCTGIQAFWRGEKRLYLLKVIFYRGKCISV